MEIFCMQWDGKKPAILYMLRDFRRYLIQKQLDELINTRKVFHYLRADIDRMD
jgi:hypothetical protein